MADPTAPNVEDRAKALLDAIWNDSDLGPKARAKAKAMYPDVTLPEDHMTPMLDPLRAQLDRTEAALARVEEERKAEREAREAEGAKQNLESAIAGARERYNLTDDGFDKMIAHMKETNNFTDADGAAAWVAQQTPVNTPTKAEWMPRKANFLGSAREEQDEAIQFLHNHPEDFLEAHLEEFAANPYGYGKAA